MKEFSTKEFATELNCSVRTLEDWRSKRSMKLLPARYDGRKAIYTSEQIPIAKALLGRIGENLPMESLFGGQGGEGIANAHEQAAPMNATQEKNFSQDTCGDSSGEYTADVDSEHVDDKSTALIIAQNKLPTRIEDVAKFALIGRDRLRAVYAEISALDKIGVVEEVRKQKLEEGQKIGELVLLAEARLGELLNQMPKTSGGDRRSANFKIPSAGKFENAESESVEIPSAKNQSGTKKPSKLEAASELGFGKNQISQFQKLADNPAAVQKAIADAKARGEIVTRSSALNEIRQTKRKQDIQRQVDEIERQEFEKPDGLFDVIVIDPPWNYGTAYNSVGRRCANPYPEMAQEELKAIELPAAADCVLFLWTTQKFIWDAKELLDHWGFDYRCMLVWNKQKMGTGNLIRMQCEFCLIGLKGKPVFADVHNIRDLIEEPAREHSRKPDAFYRLVDELCTGRKLDYFSRQKREGWTAYGNNTEKFRIDLPNQTGGGDKKIMLANGAGGKEQ